MKVIELLNVSKRFNQQLALNNVSFSIEGNEFVALVGNNGSGKSTIVNSLCNLFPCEEGSVTVFGMRLTPNYVSYRSRIGAVLSSPILIDDFSPSQYLGFVCKFQGLEKKTGEDRSQDLCRYLEIDWNSEKKIGQYSSGDRIKISIIASLIHNPELLILDEPFVHLDIQSVDLISGLFKSFKGKKTLLITSHNLDLILKLCSRVIILDEGIILENLEITDFNSQESIKREIRSRLIKKEFMGNDLTWLH
jgi:ABC-2 type transport system ATP-binding protein